MIITEEEMKELKALLAKEETVEDKHDVFDLYSETFLSRVNNEEEMEEYSSQILELFGIKHYTKIGDSEVSFQFVSKEQAKMLEKEGEDLMNVIRKFKKPKSKNQQLKEEIGDLEYAYLNI